MIGLYTGDWVVTDGRQYRGRRDDVYELDDYVRVMPPKGCLNPIARANEPPPGIHANAVFIRWTDPADVVQGSTLSQLGSVDAISLHATRDLAEGEEIYVHYGRAYDPKRSYPVDPRPAARLPKEEIRERLQQPSAIYPAIGFELPVNAWRALSGAGVKTRVPKML